MYLGCLTAVLSSEIVSLPVRMFFWYDLSSSTLIARQLELQLFDVISSVEDFSRSNDERDLPKYLNIRLDFCEDEFDMPESDGDAANVKFPSTKSEGDFLSFSLGFFLCLMREVNMIIMMTASVAPVPIATSKSSPCDFPSIETFGTERKTNNN